jgi:TonB family protein
MKKNLIKSLLALSLVGIVTSLGAASCDPVFAEGEMPEYPDFARAHGIEGIVLIEALVDEKGQVFAADVISPVHPVLDKAALSAVEKWKFTPATVEGVPTMKVVRIPISFSLVDPKQDRLFRAQMKPSLASNS